MALTKWVIDPLHSELEFKIRHLMITNVSGHFKTFNATIETSGEDFSSAKVSFTGQTDSISTGNEQRDGHLKSADFFDVEKYPEFTFESTRLVPKEDHLYVLEGNLTLHGVSKAIKLNVESGGVVKDAYGQTKTGFSVSGKLNRKEFGLNWSAVTEAGGVVVSDDVKIQAEIQFIKQ